jgi:hypothetical protein
VVTTDNKQIVIERQPDSHTEKDRQTDRRGTETNETKSMQALILNIKHILTCCISCHQWFYVLK